MRKLADVTTITTSTISTYSTVCDADPQCRNSTWPDASPTANPKNSSEKAAGNNEAKPTSSRRASSSVSKKANSTTSAHTHPETIGAYTVKAGTTAFTRNITTKQGVERRTKNANPNRPRLNAQHPATNAESPMPSSGTPPSRAIAPEAETSAARVPAVTPSATA